MTNSFDTVFFRDSTFGDSVRWLSFRDPVERLEARTLHEVTSVTKRLERAADRDLFVAGFMTFEAGAAFDQSFPSRKQVGQELPYCSFSTFRECHVLSPSEVMAELERDADGRPDCARAGWQPLVARSDYLASVREIRNQIAAGSVYQVNLTFPGEGPACSLSELYSRLERRQSAPYAAVINQPDVQVCSASPELFFVLDRDLIVCRPMKGTAQRIVSDHSEDLAAAANLAVNEKDRAENLMIVDMVRNDLGRIARTGSVTVDQLWQVESFPTVHQMTSTVSAKTDASLAQIFAALFPCASITGAPRRAALAAVERLESVERSLYTGSLGFVLPGRRAQFNVAIRTAFRRSPDESWRYDVGSGVVWDSVPELEYQECLSKALVLAPDNDSPEDDAPEDDAPRSESQAPILTVSASVGRRFSLLETLYFDGSDYWLLERHLERLTESARTFDFELRLEEVRAGLEREAEILRDRNGAGSLVGYKVRLLVAGDGDVTLESSAVTPPALTLDPGAPAWKVAIAERPIGPASPFLSNKTTHRAIYERHLCEARARHPDCDDVLLYDRRGELTESCFANIVVAIRGRLVTPPLSPKLLAGTFRSSLVEQGVLEEGLLMLSDLTVPLADDSRPSVFLVNSVRGFIPVDLLS